MGQLPILTQRVITFEFFRQANITTKNKIFEGLTHGGTPNFAI